MKNLNIISFILFLIFIQGCSIKINDDGSSDLKSTADLSDFDLSSLKKEYQYKSADEIKFQIIKGEDVLKASSEEKNTWLYLWGSWCTPCIKKLPSMIEMDKNNKNLKILFVAEDYQIASLQKLLFKNKYEGVPYILDSETYGTNTKKKAKVLNEELCPDCDYDGGFPQSYIYNKSKKLELYKVGEINNDELSGIGLKLK